MGNEAIGVVGGREMEAGEGAAVYVHLALTDPDVIKEVSQYGAGAERQQFIEMAVRIGVMSLRLAKGEIDGRALQNAGERLIAQMAERMQSHREIVDESISGTLRNYFDPASGLFVQRVESLTKTDGELARLMSRLVGAETERLRGVMSEYVGPGGSLTALFGGGDRNEFVAGLEKRVAGLLEAEREAVTGQFSLDKQDSALSRLVRELKQNHGDMSQAMATRVEGVVAEFSLDRPDSALSRLVGRVEAAQKTISKEFSLDHESSGLKRMMDSLTMQIEANRRSQSEFQSQVVGLIQGLQERRKAEAKSTTHGAIFEDQVCELVARLCADSGDVFEETGSTTGVIKNCKVGDCVWTVGPEKVAAGARVVVEAKEASGYTLASTIEESDVARRNRAAQVSVFVHSAKTAPRGLKELGRFENDIVVVWDAEAPESDVLVRAAFMLANHMAGKQVVKSTQEAASWASIDRAIEGIRKSAGGLQEITTSAETIQRAVEKQLDRARLMRKGIDEALGVLCEQLDGVRSTSSEG